MAKMIPEDDVKLCNCSECGEEILGESHRYEKKRIPEPHKSKPLVACRVQGRPICERCIHPKRCPGSGDGVFLGRFPSNDSPSVENAIRALEDTRD